MSEPFASNKRWRFTWDDNPRRSLMICAAGAVIGLAIAGFGLFTAKGTVSRTVAPENVATVNQQPILRSDLSSQLEAEFSVSYRDATPAQKHKVMEDMIREELLVQRALEMDLPNSYSDVRQTLVTAMEQQVAIDAVVQTPTDKQLEDYYAVNRGKYVNEGSMTLVDLVSATKDRAALTNAAAAIGNGTPLPAALSAYRLTDTGAVKGEEFYFAAKLHLGPQLFEAARKLASRQTVVADAADGAPHLLVMISNKTPLPEPLASIKPKVISDYQQDAAKRIQTGEVDYLRKKANILIADDFK